MHVHFKFGLFLIFILTVSTCYTRAAPATNQSSSDDDEYDDYDDYYDENEYKEGAKLQYNITEANRLSPIEATLTTFTATTNTPPLTKIVNPTPRSNHVLEPSCPSACFCLEDHKYIQCTNAQLTQVPHDLPSTALIIDLSQNDITTLHVDDFANCTKVRDINLSDNQIAEIKPAVFKDLRHLKSLRLANNLLTHIEPHTFAGASDLEALDLSNNTIELPHDGPFLHQPGLLEFICHNCSWTQLYDATFVNMSDLTMLELDKNDFDMKINTRAFTPLRSLIKLKLSQLDQSSVQELCNLLASIDNISLQHFDVSCYALVLGTSYNESVALAASGALDITTIITPTLDEQQAEEEEEQKKQEQQQNAGAGGHGHVHKQQRPNAKPNMNAADAEIDVDGDANHTLPIGGGAGDAGAAHNNASILTAGAGGVLSTATAATNAANDKEQGYSVSISQETINIMLISIMIIAVIGLIIGIICRKDVGGIKTKCCRTRKPEPKDQVHPAEEIPLNKLA